MQSGTLKLKENYTIQKVNKETGEIISEQKRSNLITNAGKTRVAHLIAGALTGFTVLAIGTGTTPAAAADTTLETEVDRDPATVTYPSSYVVQLYKEFTFGSAYDITEVGIFDSDTSSGSTMLSHVILSPAESVDASTSLRVTAQITVA